MSYHTPLASLIFQLCPKDMGSPTRKFVLPLLAPHFILYRALSLIVRLDILSNPKYNTCEVQFVFYMAVASQMTLRKIQSHHVDKTMFQLR